MSSVTIKKQNKTFRDVDLEQLTKQELIEKVICLKKHNRQLKNIIAKNLESSKSNSRTQKPYDFSKSYFRHILLKLYYLGWDYQGFATQEHTVNTIEHYLFDALQKTCLIKDRESSNYHRCGRTDKGVSAFSQVISIDVRSKFSKDEQFNVENEINYCKLLNRVLPENIQCICWTPAVSSVSARFDCKQRTYKYFFPQSTLDINAMKTALSYIVGTHDFRNFCKMDVANGVVTFVRTIISARIEKCPSEMSNSCYGMFQIVLVGNAYLWHQIRCIMGLLLLIGTNNENPEIIKELLDVDKNPR